MRGRKFQSSLELSPECNANQAQRLGNFGAFQSSLELSPECNLIASGGVDLIRGMFQSSLELSPECNRPGRRGRAARGLCFNPHSSFRPSATGLHPVQELDCQGFNPHSSFRPSATRIIDQIDNGVSVSILTRAFARVQPATSSNSPMLPKVSILTRAFARVQPPHGFTGPHALFQSSLELSPECNALAAQHY